ncbi:hypothetical protein RJT34_28319 [Clitoria ternatea]|uniref:Pentatricopeptide repeat-containing protein n=1 Tax=Clitoria ternatea TaxID=43366 RepID=A0AAN9FAT5_CLITE
MLRVSEWSFQQRPLLSTSNSKSKWSDFNQKRTVVVCGLRSSFKTRRRSRVFKYIREELELGYERLVQVYADMIEMLGRNKMREMAEELFAEVVPDTRMCSEMIGVYLKLGMTEKAMHIYGSMKEWGCAPDKLTFTILITSLQKTGQPELAETLKQDSVHYVDSPHNFLQQFQPKQMTDLPYNGNIRTIVQVSDNVVVLNLIERNFPNSNCQN